MRSKRLITCAIALQIFTACGAEYRTSTQSKSGQESAVADFITALQAELGKNSEIVSIAEVGTVDSTYSVVLSTGKKLSIQRHTEENAPLTAAIFSNFTTEATSPAAGTNTTCLNKELTAAKVAGYKPLYLGVLFSDTTMFVGYSGSSFLTYDSATGVCYASWKQ